MPAGKKSRECYHEAMPFQILEHTADFRMKVEGKTLQELFTSAFEGMVETMKAPQKPSPTETSTQKTFEHRLELKAPDVTALLIDFLNEILTLAHVNKEIYSAIGWKTLTETSLQATIQGAKVDSFDKDIKAATFHQADVKQNSKGMWETLLVFDI